MKYLKVALLLLPFFSNAQMDSVHVRRSDLIRGMDGVAYTITSPVRWKAKDWITLGGVAATCASITLLDEPVRDFFQNKHDSKFLDGFERVGYHYGKPYSAVAITGGLYLTGIIFKSEWARETGLLLATSVTTSTIVQTFFKNALGRARPSVELGNYEADPFSSEPKFHSLPSGHTTVAFTTSLILARQIKSLPVKILFYSLATCTAASRLYADAHWVSDVAFGGAIAWFCADVALKRLETNKFRLLARPSDFSVKLYPYPGGMSLRATF
jgi:membrane-associated phospholipid phosphatase